MARAHHVKKARKAIPSAGVEVGDSYYWWKFRHGGKHFSKERPRLSQLTNSDKMSRAYAAAEALEDLTIDDEATIDDVRSELDSIVSDVNEIASEYREAIDNMPENLQQGSTAQECEEKADGLESWAQEIESCLDSLDEDDADWRDEARDTIAGLAGEMPI